MQLKWQSSGRGISQIWLQVREESRKFQESCHCYAKVEKISSKMHTRKTAFLPPRVILWRWEDFRLDLLTIYNLMDISYFACQHVTSPDSNYSFSKQRTNLPRLKCSQKQEQAQTPPISSQKNEYKIMYFNQGVDKASPCISGLN